jgi:hypothetical protein
MPTNQPRVVEPLFGNIYKNLLPPETGFLIITISEYAERSTLPRWGTKAYTTCAGPIGSPAHKLYDFIEDGGLLTYPYAQTYKMISGPNSNTFVQWVLKQVPGHGLSMPINAWGKAYRFDD